MTRHALATSFAHKDGYPLSPESLATMADALTVDAWGDLLQRPDRVMREELDHWNFHDRRQRREPLLSSLKIRNPDSKTLSLAANATPLRMAPIACSRTPK